MVRSRLGASFVISRQLLVYKIAHQMSASHDPEVSYDTVTWGN
jgi:hypothetical protein